MYKKISLIFIICLISCSTAQASSIKIIQNGISGSITSSIVVDELNEKTNDSYVIVGTTLGAYILSPEGKLLNFIQTGSQITNIKVINDVNQNGFKEVVFTMVNAYFPNVLCFDPFSGQKIWEFSSETEIFDISMLWTMKQLNVFDIEVSSSREHLYMTVGYDVVCVDAMTGEEIASYQGTDNFWDISIVNDDVVVGDQNGYVYRFEDESLNLVWKKEISKPYTVVNPSTKSAVGTVTRSVWDIISFDKNGEKILAACCEDGFLYLLSFESGKTLNHVEIIDYVDSLLYNYYGDYPLSTSKYDYNFFNMKIQTIPDISSDENTDLLVYTYPGFRSGNEYSGAKMGIYCLSSSNLDVKAKMENIDLSKITTLETITSSVLDDTFFFLPLGRSGSNEKVRLMTVRDLSVEKTITINSSGTQTSSNTYYLQSINEGFILASHYGDIIKTDLNGTIDWTYQRLLNIQVEQGDMLGTDTTDLLVYSSDVSEDDNFLSEGGSQVIYSLDGEDHNVSWTIKMNYSEFINSSGYKKVQIIDDVTGDGKHDVVAYKQYDHDWGYGDEYGENTTVIVISGNGSIYYEKPLTTDTYYGYYESFLSNPSYVSSMNPEELEWVKRDRRIRKTIESFDIISDISGDGINDFLIGSWNEIYIMDSSNGKVIWTRTYNKDNYEHPYGNEMNPMVNYHWDWVDNDRLRYYSLGDQNSDGFDEILQVSWNGMSILRSKAISGSFDYQLYEEITFDDNNFDSENIRIVDDVNGDLIRDIMCLVYRQDAPSLYKILSGDSGDVLLEFEQEGTTIDLNSGDGNGDEFLESIVFYSYGSSGPLLEIISGSNNNVIWSYVEFEESWSLREQFGMNYILPACFIPDMNDDGIDDVVVGRSLPWDTGAELLIYDINQDDLIKTITIESIDQDLSLGDQRWQPAIIIEPVEDYTGDGVGEVATVMSLGESNQKQLKLVIVDIINNEIVSDFSAKGTHVESFGGMIMSYGGGGELYLMDPEKQLSIISPSDGVSTSSPLTLTWSDNDAESIKLIQVDNQNIMKVAGNSTVFDVKQGAQKISIYSYDKYGKGVYATIDVTIEKSSSSLLLLVLLSVTLIFLMFSSTILSYLRKWKIDEHKKEHSVTERGGE